MNCLRCGRTIDEASLFCGECLKTVRLPLETSEYLSDRVILPARDVPKRTELPRPTERTAEKQKPRRSRGLVVAVTVLSLLCAALLFGGARLVQHYEEWMADRERLAASQREYDRLETKLSEAETELADEQSRRQSLWAELQARNDDLDALQTRLDILSLAQNENVDAALLALRAECLQLNQQLQDSLRENRSLGETADNLRRELQTANDRLADLRAEAQFIDGNVVFIEVDGTKYYHTFSCHRFLGACYLVFNRSSAEAKGYAPCPYCGAH